MTYKELKMAGFSPFLGKGAKYPFAFDENTGGIRKASSENYYLGGTGLEDLVKINDSIAHILSVTVGTRFFLPTFGARVNDLVFEPNDDIFADAIRVYIVDALKTWEKRIDILSVDISTDVEDLKQHKSKIQINYRVISSQKLGNYVYPFVRTL